MSNDILGSFGYERFVGIHRDIEEFDLSHREVIETVRPKNIKIDSIHFNKINHFDEYQPAVFIKRVDVL